MKGNRSRRSRTHRRWERTDGARSSTAKVRCFEYLRRGSRVGEAASDGRILPRLSQLHRRHSRSVDAKVPAKLRGRRWNLISTFGTRAASPVESPVHRACARRKGSPADRQPSSDLERASRRDAAGDHAYALLGRRRGTGGPARGERRRPQMAAFMRSRSTPGAESDARPHLGRQDPTRAP